MHLLHVFVGFCLQDETVCKQQMSTCTGPNEDLQSQVRQEAFYSPVKFLQNE